MSSRRAMGLALLLLSTGLQACSSTCDPAKDNAYCEDGVAHACFAGDSATPEWHETICKGSPAPLCVAVVQGSDTQPTAFCASGKLDARCPPNPPQGGNATFCDAGKISTCVDGSVVLVQDCAPGSPGCC